MYKVKQKILSVLAACLTMLLTLVLAIASLTPVAAIADDTTASTGTWTLVTDASPLAAGDKIIIAASDYDYALSTTQNNNNRGAEAITKSGATLQDVSADVQIITLEAGKKDNTFAFHVEGSLEGYLYAASSSKNHLKTETTLSNNSSFTISITSAGVATITAQGTNTRNLLKYNNSSSKLFACYASNSTGVYDICIYKLTTTTVECDHTDTKLVSNGNNTHNKVCANDSCGYIIEKDIACTDNGVYTYDKNTADKNTDTHKHLKKSTCTACEGVYSVEEACTFGDGVVTAPTETTQGYTTYTCSVCGYSYKANYTSPTAKYTVTYSVLGKTTTEEVAYNEKATLPTQSDIGDYKFVGWTKSAIDSTTATQPECVAEQEVTEDITFYAVYSLTQGSGGYVKVTEAPTDWSGEYLIVYETGRLIFDGSSTSLSSGPYQSTTINENIITSDYSKYAFTIAKSGDDYTIQSKSGYYIGNNSNSNSLTANKTTTYKNSISLTLNDETKDINVNIISSGGAYLRYNTSDRLFRYYKSSTYTYQKAICLYKLDGKVEYMTSLATVKGSVTLGEEIKVNYNVTMPEAFEGATLQYSFNDELTTYTVTGVKNETTGAYAYSIPMAPQRMTDVIHAKLVAQDGTVIATPNDFSIRSYAQTLLQGECSDTLKQLLTDLLTYGAEAQKYQGYKTDDLANNIDEIGTPSTATPTDSDKMTLTDGEGVESFPAYFSKATVWFDNTNSVRVYVTGDTTDVTLTVNGTTVELTKTADGTYYYQTEGLKATELDTTFTFVLASDGMTLQTLTYSVNAYVYNMQSNSKIGSLALALYRYGQSAKAYAATVND